MKKHLFIVPLLLLIAAGAFAQGPAVEVEAGYRWTNIEGNEDLFRTQINEREGFVLRTLSVFSTGNGGAFDEFRIDATDFGNTPASGLRIETGKAETYRLRLGYRSFDSFSALPTFANPLLARGVQIVPGQHTYDRNRRMLDVDFEWLTLSRFSPFVGYSYSQNEGPGTTTYTIGGDDFLLGQDLDETDHEVRIGTGFSLGGFNGQITQGWRTLSADETLTLAAGGEPGNNPNPVLGRPITAGTITRSSNTEVETPFTNFYVNGNVHSRVRLIADFATFSAESEGDELESSTGSFVSFGISRFFTGLDETTTANSAKDAWRGGARAEFALTDTVTLLAGWRGEHDDLEGTALIRSLYRDTLTFSGADRRDIEEILNARSSFDRSGNTLRAEVVARAIGPFTLRAGFAQTDYEVTIAPDLSEIVVPQNQGGEFERTVQTVDVTAGYGNGPFSISASLRHDDADEAIVRTDFLGRDRARLRAAYAAKRFRFGVTAEQLDQDNNTDGNTFESESRQIQADFEFAPVAAFSVRAAYSILDAERTATIRRPESFNLETWFDEEDGTAIEAGLGLNLGRFNADASYAHFENEGSILFDLDRYRVRAVYDFLANAGLSAEWTRDKYDEASPFSFFEADRFGVFLRFRR